MKSADVLVVQRDDVVDRQTPLGGQCVERKDVVDGEPLRQAAFFRQGVPDALSGLVARSSEALLGQVLGRREGQDFLPVDGDVPRLVVHTHARLAPRVQPAAAGPTVGELRLVERLMADKARLHVEDRTTISENSKNKSSEEY